SSARRRSKPPALIRACAPSSCRWRILPPWAMQRRPASMTPSPDEPAQQPRGDRPMPAQDNNRYLIDIEVHTEFLPEQSDAESNRWVFAYHITLRNDGDQPARLMTRHWVITDGEERTHEVHGEGV